MRHRYFEEAGQEWPGGHFGDRLRARAMRHFARRALLRAAFAEAGCGRGRHGGEPGGEELEPKAGFEGRGDGDMRMGPRGFGPGRGGFRERMARHFRPLEQGDLRWLTLDLLAAQPRHGYEIIKAIEEAFSGHYAPSPGAIYPMLTLLEETGLIDSETQGAKKLYRITEAGRAEVAAQSAAIDAARARLRDSVQRFGGAPAPELMRAMDNLRAAIQVRLSKGDLAGEALQTVTAALDRAASEIERS